MSFWENVENVREYRDLSRKELAHKANFSLNSISTGITRNSIPAADVAYRIAQVLGVTLEYLITGKTHDVAAAKADALAVESAITLKREHLAKYMDAYAAVLEDFSSLPATMQKTVAELIHKIAATGTATA